MCKVALQLLWHRNGSFSLIPVEDIYMTDSFAPIFGPPSVLSFYEQIYPVSKRANHQELMTICPNISGPLYSYFDSKNSHWYWRCQTRSSREKTFAFNSPYKIQCTNNIVKRKNELRINCLVTLIAFCPLRSHIQPLAASKAIFSEKAAAHNFRENFIEKLRGRWQQWQWHNRSDRMKNIERRARKMNETSIK